MTANVNILLAIAFLASFFAVNWIFMRVLKIAKVKGLVDNPDARKLQKSPVPVLGGIAVFFGLVFGMLTFSAMYHATGVAEWGLNVNVIPILLGGSVMLYTGTLDDILGLTPRSRLVIESLTILAIIFGSGMCVDSLHGLWGVYDFTWWIAVPLTVFAGVGLINAYNMIDGVNGLSSGLCISCSLLLAGICLKRGDFANCAIAMCYAGSLFPFLLHNVFGKRSKMFIGDGGTMVMGLLVSWFMVRILSSNNAVSITSLAAGNKTMGLVAMMLAVASVPIADTLRVMTARVLRGESPFHADKTHLHHAFISCGVSHSITALLEILINLFVVLIWYVSYSLNMSVDMQLYVVVVAAMILAWGMYFLLSRIAVKHSDSEPMKWARRTHLGHTGWWLSFQRYLDKGAYEDYIHVLRKKYNKDIDDLTEDEKDIARIVNYLQGRHTVPVSDIISSVKIEDERMYALFSYMTSDEIIDVVSCDDEGRPVKVKLIYE